MSDPYILLWLEAPLQSWGHDSKFSRRDTLNFPTRSGILGLVCCALGRGGAQAEFLAEFSSLSQTALSFVRASKDFNDNLVKKSREPMLSDFHMVGSGYDAKDPWASMLMTRTIEGKKANGGGAKLTYRNYLQDAHFAVLLQVPNGRTDEIVSGLQCPVWDIYLGRKCCVPTDFIYQGLFDNESDGINQSLVVAREKSLLEDFRVLDGEHRGEALTIMDVPIRFGEHKSYRDRRVTVVAA